MGLLRDVKPLRRNELVPFASAFKKLRVGKFTHIKLAAAAGVSTSMLSLWERGMARPELSTLQRVAKAMGVSADDLYALLPAEDDEGDVPVSVSRDLFMRVIPLADAQGITPDEWINLALEGVMNLQVKTNKAKAANGAHKPRIMGTRAFADRKAAKESKDQDQGK